MKKQLQLLLISACFLVSANCIAQPTLTSSGIAYSPGYMISTIVDNGGYHNPGSSGANQTWNLTTIADSGTGIGTIVAASSIQISDSFPTATAALVSGGSYDFYTVNSSVMQLTGTASTDTTVSFDYLDPEDQLRFPFNYNDTYSDPWRAISYSDGNVRILSGTTTVTADGYGTVQTPNQTYYNAMRVHFVENYYDSNTVSGFLFVLTDKFESYRWYVNGNHYPVAEIDSASLFYLGALQYTSYSASYLNNPTGIKNIEGINSINIFPNPASDYLNLDINLASAKNVQVSIFNSIGEEMEVPTINEGYIESNRYRLDIRDLPRGIYYACILTDGVLISTVKFIVSR